MRIVWLLLLFRREAFMVCLHHRLIDAHGITTMVDPQLLLEDLDIFQGEKVLDTGIDVGNAAVTGAHIHHSQAGGGLLLDLHLQQKAGIGIFPLRQTLEELVKIRLRLQGKQLFQQGLHVAVFHPGHDFHKSSSSWSNVIYYIGNFL